MNGFAALDNSPCLRYVVVKATAGFAVCPKTGQAMHLKSDQPLYLDVLQKLILMKTNMPYFLI